MALYIEPAPVEAAANSLARQLEPIRDRFPSATVRVVPPGAPPEPFANQWRAVVDADQAEVEELKQACLDLLGD